MFNLRPKRGTRPQIIEIPKETKLPELTGDLKESLKVLSTLPAFNYLMQRMRLQKALLMSNLAQEADPRNITYLQAGLFWLGFLESELRNLTKENKPRAPEPDELREFEKIRQYIEPIGE